MGTSLFISQVRDHPVLWDRSHSDYRDKRSKTEAWQHVIESLDLPTLTALCGKYGSKEEMGTALIKRWYNIRDAYVKSIKNPSKNRPYIYSSELSFLDPVLKISVEKVEEEQETNDEMEYVLVEPWNEDISVDINEEKEEPAPKKRRNNKQEKNESLIVLADLLKKEVDEDRAFFNSITPAVKKLSDDAKLDFRIQVLSVLKNLSNTFYKIEPEFDGNESDA